MAQLVVFTLDDRRYGLALSAVERAVRMVDVTPLPQAPQIVLGVVNVQGRVVPVVNLRRRFRLPERDFALADQLLIARTARRPGVGRGRAGSGRHILFRPEFIDGGTRTMNRASPYALRGAGL